MVTAAVTLTDEAIKVGVVFVRVVVIETQTQQQPACDGIILTGSDGSTSMRNLDVWVGNNSGR